jgi:LexA-binding, inner membrane-associated putative hydrolase
MANFTTHIAVGTVVSGALATLTLASNVIGPESLIAVTMAGVLGSVLPDIDLKDSRPSRAMFAGLGIFFSFAVLFSCAGKYSIVELWMLWLGTLVGVRYGLHAVFHRIAVHRGIWHSLLATVFVSLLTVLGFKYILDREDGVAWLGAAFMAVGYLTHLVLDELYSVDVMDTRLKASFGTAIKLIDIHNWKHSVAMAVMTVGLAMIVPSPATFVEGVTSPALWTSLKQKLLPRESLFGVIDIHHGTVLTGPPTVVVPNNSVPTLSEASKTAAAPVAPTAPLTTGSIPPASPFRTIATDVAPPAK